MAFHQRLSYVTISLTGLLLPEHYGVVFNSAFPALLGETALMLWLVIKGARPLSLDVAASVSAAG